MQTVKKLLFLLSPNERKSAGLLLIMIIIMAFLDTLGVASILPFMAVLTNPDLIETNFLLKNLYEFSRRFSVENNQQFIFFLGVIVFIFLITSLAFKMLTIYVQVRFIQMREFTIGKRLIEGYLNQPYSWFLSRHSADLGKNILSEVQQSIVSGLNPLIELIAKCMIAIAIISLLIITEPKLAFIVGLSLGGAYLIIFLTMRKYLTQMGDIRLKNNQLRFTVVNESFGAVKEIKIGRLEHVYIKLFANASEKFAKTQATTEVIAALPRFILEAIAFGGVLLMILYFISEKGGFNSALPILSLYVFAGYRLMPALQQIYVSFTQLSFVGPAVDKLYEDLNELKFHNNNRDSEDEIIFQKSIALKDLQFNYPNSSRRALQNINIKIPAKSKVGIVGATGSGKTSLIDIILCLLEPQKGTLEVDEKIITKNNHRSWQRLIGYVPQSIYLIDDSIAANIALGIDKKDIIKDSLEKAAKIANLHEFILNELPSKYDTIIGERGVRLSGGQRQRIGLARALYHNPEVLILDEATSSLDIQTEKAVMDALNNFNKDITIILIAHRLDTIKKCDIIFKVDKGQVVEQGTFNDIINKSSITKNENN